MDTPDLTAVAEKLGRGTEQLTTETQERARELRQRVGSSLEDLQAGQHVREVGDQLRQQLDDTIKPAVHKAAPGLGKGLLTAIQALASLPLLLMRALGRLVSTAESVPERSVELRERAQHLMHDNPLARRQRRERRKQLAMWTGAGFGVGVGLGWFLGRRSATEMVYDPPLPVPAVAPPPFASASPASPTSPTSPTASSVQTLPKDPFEAAAAAEEVLEDQLAAAADTEAMIDTQLEEAAQAEADGGGSSGAADEDASVGEGEATDRPTSEA